MTWLLLTEQTRVEDIILYTGAGFDLHIIPQEEKLQGITCYIGTFRNVDDGKTLVLKAVE